MKPDLNHFAEVMSAVQFKTSDGGTINVNLEGDGEIEFIPWTSNQEGDITATYEDRIVIHPASGHDVMILEFLAEHARRLKAMSDAEEEAREADEKKKPAAIVAGPGVTREEFALR